MNIKFENKSTQFYYKMMMISLEKASIYYVIYSYIAPPKGAVHTLQEEFDIK